jgi:peptidoglycan/LPS O-acetylase OafA/YrhL
LQYRKEIDGLRAIAVLPVILFHAGISGFSGGYVGVDIFFVISGFLITSIIIEDLAKDRFSIVDFYERRARRVLPALTIVLISTTIAAYIFMPAYFLKQYSQSLVSVMTFSSNVYFFLTSGYFSTISDHKPLLHTWSLAVEEQFYLFFPVMVMLLWSRVKNWILPIIVLLSVISLVCAQVLVSINAVDANFYLIFSRAWELLFGSIVAFVSLQKLSLPRWKSDILSCVGLLMVVFSIAFFDEKTPFPSFYTLIPVLGTCMIILFATPKSYVARYLGSRIIVFVGVLSYSLYLWHQPLFAFLRLKTIGEPSFSVFIGAIVATFILALVSWKFVEQPFRNRVKFDRIAIFRLTTLSIIMFTVIGLSGHLKQGFEHRFDTVNYADTIKFSPKRDKCHTRGIDFLQPSEACTYFGQNITWASFGDSHTVEPAYALATRLKPYDNGLVQLSFSSCAPALKFDVKRLGCSKWINDSLDYLEENKNIKNILLGFRYSAFLYGEQLKDYPNPPNIDPRGHFTAEFLDSESRDLREVYWDSFNEIISRLLKAGKNVHILYPIPELPIDINTIVSPFSIFGGGVVYDLDHTTSADYFFSRNDFILGKLDSLSYGKNLYAIKPFEIICKDGFCPAVKDNKALYFDDDHLSLSGARLVADEIDIENQTLNHRVASATENLGL